MKLSVISYQNTNILVYYLQEVIGRRIENDIFNSVNITYQLAYFCAKECINRV